MNHHSESQGAGAVIDPVCEMSIDPTNAAATRTYEGVEYYFCSDWCAEEFDAKPASFVAR